MKIQALAEFTKQITLYGSDSAEVLDKFLLYAKLCRDPINIFLYMEEKTICTFTSHYWVSRADYYAEIGDYKSAFEFIKQAQIRTGISEEVEQKLVHPQLYILKYKNQIISEIRSRPILGRRTAQQYQFISSNQEEKPGNQEQKIQRLLVLWNTKYSFVRVEREKKAELKRENFPYSWLYEIYKQKQEKSKKIREGIKSTLAHTQNLEQYHHITKSLNTPYKKRDPNRISKTIDSVQMLKRKKSTGQKIGKKKQYEGQASQSDNQENSSQTRFVQSIPVGKKFQLLTKHVTFRKDNESNVEKIRRQKSEHNKSVGFSIQSKSHLNQNGLRRSIIRNASKSPRSSGRTLSVQRPLIKIEKSSSQKTEQKNL